MKQTGYSVDGVDTPQSASKPIAVRGQAVSYHVSWLDASPVVDARGVWVRAPLTASPFSSPKPYRSMIFGLTDPVSQLTPPMDRMQRAELLRSAHNNGDVENICRIGLTLFREPGAPLANWAKISLANSLIKQALILIGNRANAIKDAEASMLLSDSLEVASSIDAIDESESNLSQKLLAIAHGRRCSLEGSDESVGDADFQEMLRLSGLEGDLSNGLSQIPIHQFGSDLAYALIGLLNHRAQYLYSRGRYREMEFALSLNLALIEAIHITFPELRGLATRYTVGTVLGDRALARHGQNRDAEALQDNLDAQAVAVQLKDEYATSWTDWFEIQDAQCWMNISQSFTSMLLPSRALEAANKAITILQSIRSRGPSTEEFEVHRQLGHSLANRGSAFVNLSRYLEALESFDQALEHLESATRIAPERHELREILAHTLVQRGKTLRVTGRWQAAISDFDRANVLIPISTALGSALTTSLNSRIESARTTFTWNRVPSAMSSALLHMTECVSLLTEMEASGQFYHRSLREDAFSLLASLHSDNDPIKLMEVILGNLEPSLRGSAPDSPAMHEVAQSMIDAVLEGDPDTYIREEALRVKRRLEVIRGLYLTNNDQAIRSRARRLREIYRLNEQADELLREHISKNPWSGTAHILLAEHLASTARQTEAMKHYDIAVDLLLKGPSSSSAELVKSICRVAQAHALLALQLESGSFGEIRQAFASIVRWQDAVVQKAAPPLDEVLQIALTNVASEVDSLCRDQEERLLNDHGARLLEWLNACVERAVQLASSNPAPLAYWQTVLRLSAIQRQSLDAMISLHPNLTSDEGLRNRISEELTESMCHHIAAEAARIPEEERLSAYEELASKLPGIWQLLHATERQYLADALKFSRLDDNARSYGIIALCILVEHSLRIRLFNPVRSNLKRESRGLGIAAVDERDRSIADFLNDARQGLKPTLGPLIISFSRALSDNTTPGTTSHALRDYIVQVWPQGSDLLSAEPDTVSIRRTLVAKIPHRRNEIMHNFGLNSDHHNVFVELWQIIAAGGSNAFLSYFVAE